MSAKNTEPSAYKLEIEYEVVEPEDNDTCSSAATTVLQKEAVALPEAFPVPSDLMKNYATTSHEEPKNATEAGEKTSQLKVKAAPYNNPPLPWHVFGKRPRTENYQIEFEFEEPEENEIYSSGTTLDLQKKAGSPPEAAAPSVTATN